MIIYQTELSWGHRPSRILNEGCRQPVGPHQGTVACQGLTETSREEGAEEGA